MLLPRGGIYTNLTWYRSCGKQGMRCTTSGIPRSTSLNVTQAFIGQILTNAGNNGAPRDLGMHLTHISQISHIGAS